MSLTASEPALRSASRCVTVRGRSMHLRTWGDPAAPPLLLLHGAMDSSAPYQFVVEHLPAGRLYVAPDWCGGGRSDPAWSHWFPDYVACFADWRDVSIPDAGHMIQYDQPRRLAAEMVRFFAPDQSRESSS